MIWGWEVNCQACNKRVSFLIIKIKETMLPFSSVDLCLMLIRTLKSFSVYSPKFNWLLFIH